MRQLALRQQLGSDWISSSSILIGLELCLIGNLVLENSWTSSKNCNFFVLTYLLSCYESLSSYISISSCINSFPFSSLTTIFIWLLRFEFYEWMPGLDNWAWEESFIILMVDFRCNLPRVENLTNCRP